MLPQATLYDQSYKGRIYQTHAVATDEFIRLGKGKVEGTVLAAGSMLVIDDIAPTDPIKKVALASTSTRTRSSSGSGSATFGANTYDAGLLLQQAIPVALKTRQAGNRSVPHCAARRAGAAARHHRMPGRVQHESDESHNGMDERARVLIIVRDGRFRLCFRVTVAPDDPIASASFSPREALRASAATSCSRCSKTARRHGVRALINLAACVDLRRRSSCAPATRRSRRRFRTTARR